MAGASLLRWTLPWRLCLRVSGTEAVREEMGLRNVIPMISVGPDEGRRCWQRWSMVWSEVRMGCRFMWCELPSNVIMAEEFSEVFDGFSIGSNDLTQLTLGLTVIPPWLLTLFDERNQGVKRMVKWRSPRLKRTVAKWHLWSSSQRLPWVCPVLSWTGDWPISLNPDSVLL